MPKLRTTLHLEAPPPVAWDLISRYEHWPTWGVTVRAVEPSAGRVEVGHTGRVQTPARMWLPFEITDVTEGRAWTWRVAGIDATGHRVEPAEGGCTVTMTAPLWAPFYLPVLAASLRRLRREAARWESRRPETDH